MRSVVTMQVDRGDPDPPPCLDASQHREDKSKPGDEDDRRIAGVTDLFVAQFDTAADVDDRLLGRHANTF